MFDRLPPEPTPHRDRRTRCERCEHALTADDIRCPRCAAPHPHASAIYHLRKNRRLQREKRMQAAAERQASRSKKEKTP